MGRRGTAEPDIRQFPGFALDEQPCVELVWAVEARVCCDLYGVVEPAEGVLLELQHVVRVGLGPSLEKAADSVPAQPRGYGLVVLDDEVLCVICLEAVPEGWVHAGRAEGCTIHPVSYTHLRAHET